MAKLNDYAAVTRFDSNGILMTDGSSGTRKITANNAAIDLAGRVSSEQHRSIYGGRNLGSTFTDAQKAAISSGTFDNLYIGDYWTINGVHWIIADMDYFYNCGDSRLTKHHLVIIPAGILYSYKMNTSNTTEGGYVNSLMYTEGLNQAKESFALAFPNLVLTHRDFLINAVTQGRPSGAAWFDSTVELMSEIHVYGTHFYHPMNTGDTIPALASTATRQFSLFRLNSSSMNIGTYYWLRDVVSATRFARFDGSGRALSDIASLLVGVRPYAVIGL